MVDQNLREQVRQRYALAAVNPTCCQGTDRQGVFGADLYPDVGPCAAPAGVVEASLGCGNPTAVAELREGETVLDLGSGGGLDALLSAGRVGPTGFVYGVDMTDEMLALARKNAADSGATNVEFLSGTIEDLPLPDASIDVVISNCVINLSVDKPAVFKEIARVLKDGGRIGISDIVADNQLSQEERRAKGSYAGCIAGALSFAEYEAGLSTAGFQDIQITPTHEVVSGMSASIIKAYIHKH